ncbi:RlpA-like double-psi beta-barrel-protein domain-containing protein-containing protein [Desarmillaria tabescens]|uniref:RlpA-like double-psi beta-barrel-protein domain-containing protein-containing protein n=1 Tax=Armillaria tabescens TaxID=1929756 RepID=A0AA39NG98_ARMTA|nr:RlpA-like double-psi beta-barrel-protein domain-containing protein-containing protein [Desarmillaria tabescens]KAK0465091.1 RlpA-like double-psi beta-barrel-protein domain-containing protein-containing protein [Desarmillaria tabescens]
MFPSFLVVLTFISLVSALASPHMSQAVHRHRSLSARIAAPVAEPLVDPQPVLPKRTRSRRLARRASSGRCNASSVAQASSTALAQQASSTTPVHTTSATPESTSAAPATSFTQESTSVEEQHTLSSSSFSSSSSSSVAQETQPAAPTTTAAPQTTSTTSSAQATSTSGSSGGSTSSTHTGEITFYDTGLGSCGETSSDTDHIVALSQTLYDQYTTNGNSNDNSLCGKYIHIQYGSKSTDVKVVDRCTGCAEYDLDLSPAAFDDLASESVGRLQAATWYFTS